ncbi:MAG: rod shape-determining protein MreD [Verrucomicrobia bacterium]|nr:rod shape-determining protein MreD [Verrucomicrobiota bacterium]
MKGVPLLFPFSLALFATLLFPMLPVCAFAPFLALLYQRKSLLFSLWVASGCGLLIDLLSAEMRLGIYAFNYGITTLLLYNQRKHFFEDKPLAISLYTAVISILSTLIQAGLFTLSGRKLEWSAKWVATDLLLMPALDALYAALWISFPCLLYLTIRRIGVRELYRRALKRLHLDKEAS